MTTSKTFSIYTFNRLAKVHGLKLYAGRGYYYWVCLDAKLETPDSVYVYRFNQLPESQWIYELEDAVEQANEFRKSYYKKGESK